MNSEPEATYQLVAKTFQGLESILASELTELGATDIEIGRRMVAFTGNKELMYRANFQLRTAIRVLKTIKRFRATTADEVYEKVKSIDWTQYLDLTTTFAVDSVVYSNEFRHSKFVAYKVKDAIVDQFREKTGERPNIRVTNPDLQLHIHVAEFDCTLSMDSSGESLHRRGYRQESVEAPLNEVLAAGIILQTGWNGQCDFIDPMCGSGTIAIEAALMASGKAPGMLKMHFGFQSIKGYNRIIPGEKAPIVAPRQYGGASPDQIWKEMKIKAREEEKKEGLPRIIATDISPEAIENAHTNAIAAGVADMIEFKACDFEKTPIPEGEKGAIFFNPEYGIRLGTYEELAPVYERIGKFLNEKCLGWTGGLITGNPDLARLVDLYYKKRVPFFNGPIDCRLFVYQGCEKKGNSVNEQ